MSGTKLFGYFSWLRVYWSDWVIFINFKFMLLDLLVVIHGYLNSDIYVYIYTYMKYNVI